MGYPHGEPYGHVPKLVCVAEEELGISDLQINHFLKKIFLFIYS